MLDMSDENYFHINSAFPGSSLKALMCVPISMGEHRIGVMTVHQRSKHGRFTNRHLNLLQGFAAQAAVAIHNAGLYTEVKMKLAEVTTLSEELREKNQFLLKRNEVHETLTQLSLNNKGVETIIVELNRMMNETVFFFDFLDTEYRPKNHEHYPPFRAQDIARIFHEQTQPVHLEVPEQSGITYYLYPILTGAVFLGSFIVPLVKPISQLDQITLEQGGSILALELVKQQTLTEVYYKKTHELFSEMLQKKDSALLYEKAKELGIRVSPFISV